MSKRETIKRLKREVRFLEDALNQEHSWRLRPIPVVTFPIDMHSIPDPIRISGEVIVRGESSS